MASLPPLKVPKKPVGLESPTGLVSIGQLPDSTAGKNELNMLLKKTSALLAVCIFTDNVYFLSYYVSLFDLLV